MLPYNWRIIKLVSVKINLTQRQINKFQKVKESGKGVRFSIKYDQIKSGGFLPLLLAGLSALGAVAGGSSAIANTIINKKAKDKELEELKRHNKVMEGKGLKKSASNNSIN